MEIDIYNYGDLSKYDYAGDLITLGYEFLFAKKTLSGKDFSTFVSDTITHELMHGILIKEFNLTTSKLFDVKEHLICNIKIKKKVFKAISKYKKSRFPITWHDSILEDGFKLFLDDYHIDINDLIQSYILTGRS